MIVEPPNEDDLRRKLDEGSLVFPFVTENVQLRNVFHMNKAHKLESDYLP